MQNIEVYPKLSVFFNHAFAQVFGRATPVSPHPVLQRTSTVIEEASVTFAPSSETQDDDLAIKELDVPITVHIDDEPTIIVRGVVDEANYLTLIDHAHSIYAQGYRKLTVDLGRCTTVKLSGLFALVTLYTLFRGETPNDPTNGLHGLRQMVKKNRALGFTDTVRCLNATPKVKEILVKNGLVPDEAELMTN